MTSKFNMLSEPLNHPNEFLLCAHCDNGGHSSCLYGDIRRGYFDTYLCREHAKLHVVKSVGDSVTHVYYKDDLVWVISEIDSAICWVKAQIFDFTRPSGGDVCAYVRKVGGHMCALGDRNQVLIVKFCELRPRDSEGCAPSYDMVNRQFQDLSVLVVSRSEDSVQCIYPCDPACLSEFMSDWVRTHSAQRCNDGGLGVCKPKKPKSRRRVAKDKEDGTAPHRTGSVPEVEVPVQEAAELVPAKKSQSRRRAPKAQSGGSASQVAGSVPTVEVSVPDATELVQARRNFRAILETNAQNAFKNQRGNTSSRKLEASPKDEVVLTGTMASHFSSLKPQIFVRTGVKNRSSRTKGPHKPADDHSAPSSPSVLSSTSTPQKPKSRRHARVSSSIEDDSPFIDREAVEDFAAQCEEEDGWLSPDQFSTPEAKALQRDDARSKSAAVINSPAICSKRRRLKHAGSTADRNALVGGTIEGNTHGDSKQLYAATDAGVKYSIDGDPQSLMVEDAAARAQFRMAGDAAARVASDSIYTPQPPQRFWFYHDVLLPTTTHNQTKTWPMDSAKVKETASQLLAEMIEPQLVAIREREGQLVWLMLDYDLNRQLHKIEEHTHKEWPETGESEWLNSNTTYSSECPHYLCGPGYHPVDSVPLSRRRWHCTVELFDSQLEVEGCVAIKT